MYRGKGDAYTYKDIQVMQWLDQFVVKLLGSW